MPLFVPFAVFLLNSAFLHSESYDRVFTSKDACMDVVTAQVTHAMEQAPEGYRVIGGCLPLPEGTKPPTEAPKSSEKPPKITGPTTSI